MLFTIPFVFVTAFSLVSASPIEVETEKVAVIPLTRKTGTSSHKSSVQAGKHRLAAINGLKSFDASLVGSSATIANVDVHYTVLVNIGGENWELVLDTGSANMWCGAAEPYVKTATGTATGRLIHITYGLTSDASFSGTEYKEKVSFGGFTVAHQLIAAASSTQGLGGVPGVFGLGPVGSTAHSVASGTVPTFMNNLKAQGSIKTEVFALYFRPLIGSNVIEANGEMTIGGVDTTKYKGPLTYFPKVTRGAIANYWGVHVNKITYGSTTLSLSSNAIVDAGTTLTWIPSSAFNAFLSATHGKVDEQSGLPSFTTKPTANLGFTIGSTTYTLTPAQYLVPQAQFANFGMATGKYYAMLGSAGNSDINIILGQKFLEYYYSVYDETNSRIGFAANV
ncbi:related to aspartic proteinase precursor [Rhynchosporium secalis]|uniref:Related to aspartic proteinase n=1 Tax=Rhynchosporium secalis TaxID=38038 RepID=A0A1E1M7X4_RHYSE|nr:related to aspartic proteinase precursor [Rhynchosporium secalis]